LDASSPILLLDTGVGGLTIYDAVRDLMADAPIIFAADYAGLPYGKKTEAQVSARVAGLLGRMSERYAPRLICIACNTASTIALGNVREVLEVPIVGTVPAIKPAALSSKTGVIGLLGTQATVRQPYVDQLEAEFVNGGHLLRHAAPELVGEAEAKLRGREVDKSVLKAALEGLAAQDNSVKLSAIVLGCTHFPLLREELEQVATSETGLPADIRFVDGAAGIAQRIAHLIEGQPMKADRPNRFIVTGSLGNAAGLETALAARGFGPAETF